MVKSEAETVNQYLKQLPDDRRKTIKEVRKLILEHLPPGYRESMNWGMISYEIPLERYPDTYNGQPLGYVALAAQKNYNALYLMNVYRDPEMEKFLKEAFEKAGKKLDMGKSCIRFKQPGDMPLKAIAEIISRTSPEELIKSYEQNRT